MNPRFENPKPNIIFEIIFHKHKSTLIPVKSNIIIYLIYLIPSHPQRQAPPQYKPQHKKHSISSPRPTLLEASPKPALPHTTRSLPHRSPHRPPPCNLPPRSCLVSAVSPPQHQQQQVLRRSRHSSSSRRTKSHPQGPRRPPPAYLKSLPDTQRLLVQGTAILAHHLQRPDHPPSPSTTAPPILGRRRRRRHRWTGQ